MSNINFEDLLNMEYNEKFSTQRELILPGDYSAMVSKATIVSKLIDGEQILDLTEKGRMRFKVSFKIFMEDGVEKFITKFFFLEHLNGRILYSEDRNLDFRQFLAALGLNGKSWSVNSLAGQGPITISVSTEPGFFNPEEIVNTVKGFRK